MKKIIVILFLIVIGIFLFVWHIYTNKEEQALLTNEYPQSVKNNISPSQIQEMPENLSLPDKKISIIFAGDMNFDRHIRQMGSKNGYDFILKDVSELMQEGDCFIANLEGPITDNASVSVNSEIGSAKNYQFTFDPQITSLLYNHNVCLVNIGNNHIHNFDDAGIISTREYLKNADIAYFGDTGKDEINRSLVKNFGNTKIGFVNYNAFVADAFTHATSDIIKIKDQSDFIVVYTHWGVEYATTSRATERDIAHQLIDDGADVIIGSHPHVMQESEKYKGKMIYYSLGNFIFDQYFQPETQKGLLVRVTFDKNSDTLSFQEFNVNMKNTGQTVTIKE